MSGQLETPAAGMTIHVVTMATPTVGATPQWVMNGSTAALDHAATTGASIFGASLGTNGSAVAMQVPRPQESDWEVHPINTWLTIPVDFITDLNTTTIGATLTPFRSGTIAVVRNRCTTSALSTKTQITNGARRQSTTRTVQMVTPGNGAITKHTSLRLTTS